MEATGKALALESTLSSEASSPIIGVWIGPTR
jgi:hypothetical protein